MSQHVGVFACGRHQRERPHEEPFVTLAQVALADCLRACHQPSQLVVRRRRVREKRHLVRRVETDECTRLPVSSEEIGEPAIGKHPLDEILAKARVGEAALFFDRKRTKPVLQRRGKQPTPRPIGHAGRRVDFNAFHAAARRILLQNIAGQVLGGQILYAPGRPAIHAIGVVDGRPRRDNAELVARPVRANEAERLARGSHADFDFRADRNPLDVWTEDLRKERVALVPAIESNLLSEEAGGNADSDL